MNLVLPIALGGAIGALARHYVGMVTVMLWGAAFPWGTLIINITGSCVMGAVISFFSHEPHVSPEIRTFLTIGFLGAFTTFSTFSLDVVTLWQRGEVGMAGLYMMSSVVLSIMALMAGMYAMKGIIS